MNVFGVEDISFIIDLSGRDLQDRLVWDSSYFTFIAVTSPSHGSLTDACNNNTVINSFPYRLSGDRIGYEPDLHYNGSDSFLYYILAVSYTHLTLPTSDLV